jgi:hypothetical protein
MNNYDYDRVQGLEINEALIIAVLFSVFSVLNIASLSNFISLHIRPILTGWTITEVAMHILGENSLQKMKKSLLLLLNYILLLWWYESKDSEN